MSSSDPLVPCRMTLEERSAGRRPKDPLLGCLLGGRFRVLEVLGRGGMANVYQAYDAQEDKVVALKLLDVMESDDRIEEDLSVLAQRFMREGTLHATLRHPHIVRVFEHGMLPEGYLYISMECLRGVTLARLLAVEGRLSAERTVHIGLQVCDALRETHRLGVVHRDIKPGNVFLTRENDDPEFARLLDFGAGKWLGADNSVTLVGTVLGSPSGMSPEQIRGETVDERTDIYSVGVLLYRCLTGTWPFRGDTTLEVLAGHLHREPPELRVACPDLQVSSDLEVAIRTCMAKDPSLRYRDMDEVAWALRFALAAEWMEDDEPSLDLAVEDLEDVLDLDTHSMEILPAEPGLGDATEDMAAAGAAGRG